MTGPGHLGDDAPCPAETGLGLRQEPVRGTWGGGGRCKEIQDTGGALWWAPSTGIFSVAGSRERGSSLPGLPVFPRDARCFPPSVCSGQTLPGHAP